MITQVDINCRNIIKNKPIFEHIIRDNDDLFNTSNNTDDDFKAFKQRLEYITQYGGISGAISSLCYYHQTTKFYDLWKQDIWDALYDNAEEYGMTTIEFINSLNGAKEVGTEYQFKNLLAFWFYECMTWELLNHLEDDEPFTDAVKDELLNG